MEPRLATPGFRLGNVEIIRGIAALMVVAAHASGALAARGAELGALTPLFNFGVAGVDLFFVISGFVIVWSQLSKPRSTWAFMKNRIRRIVPLYWILTILATAVILTSTAVGLPAEGQDASAALFFSSLFFVSGAAGFPYPMLYQGWTLEYEMLFYVIFAATLFLRRVWVTIGFTSIALIALVLFTPVSSRLVEFTLGMAVAVAINFLPPPATWLARSILIVGTIAFLSTSVLNLGAVPIWILWGVPSALIVYGAAAVSQRNTRVGVELGSASYAVYLIQWFTIPAMAKIVDLSGTDSQFGFLLWGIAMLLVTQAAGIVFTRFVDKPMTRLLRSKGF